MISSAVGQLATILLVVFSTIEGSTGFRPIQPTLSKIHAQVGRKPLLSSPSDEDKDAPVAEEEPPAQAQESENPLSKLNSFLDTPILDANNKADEGPIAEALKEFVRDDSEMASITFSVVVVVFFAVVTRGAMYLINGY